MESNKKVFWTKPPEGGWPEESNNWIERFDEEFNYHHKDWVDADIRTVKRFIQQEIDKAREEGYVNRGAVESQIKEGIRQDERRRIISLIEGMKTSIGDIYYSYAGGMPTKKDQLEAKHKLQALEAIKNKIQ